MDGVTFLFFLSSRGRNVSWERLLSLDPLEIAGTIKKKGEEELQASRFTRYPLTA